MGDADNTGKGAALNDEDPGSLKEASDSQSAPHAADEDKCEMQVDSDNKTAEDEEDQTMALDNASAGSSTGSNEEPNDEDRPYRKIDPICSFQPLSSAINAFTEMARTGFLFRSPLKEGTLSNWESSKGNMVIRSASVNRAPAENGEDRAFYTTDAFLYEFYDGDWKERGKGEVQINFPDNQMGRFVMRTYKQHELILNTKYEHGMKVNHMEDRSVIFQCINGAAKGETTALRTYALKFKDLLIALDFCDCFSI